MWSFTRKVNNFLPAAGQALVNRWFVSAFRQPVNIFADPGMSAWRCHARKTHLFARALRQAIEPTCAPGSLIARHIGE